MSASLGSSCAGSPSLDGEDTCSPVHSRLHSPDHTHLSQFTCPCSPVHTLLSLLTCPCRHTTGWLPCPVASVSLKVKNRLHSAGQTRISSLPPGPAGSRAHTPGSHLLQENRLGNRSPVSSESNLPPTTNCNPWLPPSSLRLPSPSYGTGSSVVAGDRMADGLWGSAPGLAGALRTCLPGGSPTSAPCGGTTLSGQPPDPKAPTPSRRWTVYLQHEDLPGPGAGTQLGAPSPPETRPHWRLASLSGDVPSHHQGGSLSPPGLRPLGCLFQWFP